MGIPDLHILTRGSSSRDKPRYIFCLPITSSSSSTTPRKLLQFSSEICINQKFIQDVQSSSNQEAAKCLDDPEPRNGRRERQLPQARAPHLLHAEEAPSPQRYQLCQILQPRRHHRVCGPPALPQN